jgi:hypothetical protein
LERVHDKIVHLDLRTQLEHPPEERSGHLHLLGETPSHCPSEKPDLKFGLVWERNENLLFLFLQMLLRDLLSLRALPQKCWCGGAQRVGGLQIFDVDDGLAQRGRRRHVRAHVVDGGAEQASWGGCPQVPQVPLEGEDRDPALLMLV